ncbi:MAG: radical SAM protein [Synergistaceae bacterium]|nr:radical SAM protein [Synergistaceae bacterium]
MLVISPDSGKWIVLDSQSQINIFKAFMNGMNLSEVLEKFSSEINEVKSVVTQIEGRGMAQKYLLPDDEESFNLRLYLTNNCNLRCNHCFMYASSALENELTFDEICSLLENARRYGCRKIILTGGEVLMRKDFNDIIKISASLGLYVQVLTNGTLWDETRVAKLSPYINEIQISVDGFDEQSNSEIRGRNAFIPAMNTLESFLKYPDILTIAVITPSYDGLEQHIIEYKEFAKRLADKNILVLIQKELLDGRNLIADTERNKKLEDSVNKIYSEIYPNSELTSFINTHRGNNILRGCGWGNLTVSASGDVYFCGRVHDVRKYANIRTNNFDDIMTIRKLVRQRSFVDYLQPCCNCELKYICGGGCRVKNFPDIVKADIKDFSLETFTSTRKIKCSGEYKEKFYRLMIESNSFLI